MAAAITTDAVLLRAVVYGEADRVVTLLGLITGRVAALAGGGRKGGKRRGGGLELGLLGRLGIGASFDCVACGRGEADLGEETTRWHPERGGVVCRDCVRTGALLTAETRRALVRLHALSLEEADHARLDRDLNAG